MRVSTPGITSRLLNQISTSQQRLQEVQEQVSTGRRINRPSDDPFGSSRVMIAKTRLDAAGQYERNIQIAHIDLGVSESALASVNTVLQRAVELAVQSGNASLDATSRKQIAFEIDRMLEEAVAIGNTSHAGRYIFAGHQTTAVPFAPDVPGNPTVVNYSGDAGAIEREISAGERLNVNVPGDQLFNGVFNSLITFRDNLRANDLAGLQTDAQAFNDEIDRVLQYRGDIGSKMRRLEMAETRLQDENLQLKTMIGELEDADFVESVAQLQIRDSALQAALAAVGKSLNMSLLDFLR